MQPYGYLKKYLFRYYQILIFFLQMEEFLKLTDRFNFGHLMSGIGVHGIYGVKMLITNSFYL